VPWLGVLLVGHSITPATCTRPFLLNFFQDLRRRVAA